MKMKGHGLSFDHGYVRLGEDESQVGSKFFW